MIVIDASATFEVLLATPLGLTIAERLFSAPNGWHAPHLLDLEVTNTLRRLRLRGEISTTEAKAAMRDLAEMRIVRHEHLQFLPRVWELHHNLTPYDAVYLALAERLDATLVTCDAAFATVHGRRARVEVY